MGNGNIGIVKKLVAAAGVGQVNDLLNEKYVAKIPAILTFPPNLCLFHDV